ncbi:MAG: DNA polymerase I [Clostridia bacterium]|nr:DNA polymerase I [Clostridia bacterium]
MSNVKKILAVDGNSIVNRAFYGIRALTTRDGTPTNAIYGMINIITKQWEVVRPDFAVMAFDLKAPTFRHEMYTEYKAGRRPAPPELIAQFPLAKECAGVLGFHVLERKGYEADDILGTVARMAEENGAECYILTGDRDALQLISPRVHVLLATNTETLDFDEQTFFEKYGVASSQFVDVKALMGDSSDNIPGVPGIGEKTALKLIAEHGSLDGVYATLETAKHTPSVLKKLTEGRESAYLSQKLARIFREVPLSLSLDDFATQGMDSSAALDFFTRMEFAAMIKRFGLASQQEAKPAAADDGAVGQMSLDEALAPPPERSAALSEEEIVTVGVAELCALPGDELLSISIQQDCMLAYDGKRMMRLSADALTAADAKAALEAFLTGHSRIICHDCKTLYHTLERYGIHFRGCYCDVMLAAYVVNAGEGSYELDRLALSYLQQLMEEDAPAVDVIYRLYPVLLDKVRESGQESLLFSIEMPLSAVLTDMEREGSRVDCEGIDAYGVQLDAVARELEERIYGYVGHDFNINSPKQLGVILFEELSLPGPKKTKTGYSTGAEVLEKLRAYHPIIADILEYRQVTKLKSTYVDGLLKVVAEDGRVHTHFKQTGTATGRLSSAEPNLQNIPIRTELGRQLRRYFIPKSSDYVLIDADYSQIELRLLAAISGDDNMREAFCSGQDIHTSTAATVFGVAPEQVTLELRKRAKAVNFGIVYGMGEFSLAEDLHISRVEAKEYIDSYLASYPRIDKYLKDIKVQAHEDGYVTTLFGRRRYIPELSASNKMLRAFGERVAMNSPIQGTAADVMKIAMIAVDRKLKEAGIDAKLILQVHDELIIEAHRDVAQVALDILCTEMRGAAALSVPLDVEAAIGDNWYEAK